jgi:hypothetical protein
MAQQPKLTPPEFDSDAVFRRWTEGREKCRCKTPIPGSVHGGVQYCRVCREPLPHQRKKS